MNEQLLDRLKALADPLRLRMIAILRAEELAVTELAEVLSISQPRVSHHLKVLREADIVTVRHEGTWTFCSIVAGESPGDGLLAALEPMAGGFEPHPDDQRRLHGVMAQRRKRSKEFFESVAADWNELEPRFAGNGLRHQALSFLLPEGLVFADIGCGTGFMSRTLATRARKVILIDHSPAMLDQAKAELGTIKGVELDFRVAELDSLPLDDAEVDGAFANLVLHHVPDLGATLRELHRVIKTGGRLVISDLLPHEVESLREEQADLRLGLSPDELAVRLEQAGFAQLEYEEAVDALWITTEAGEDELLPIFVMSARRP